MKEKIPVIYLGLDISKDKLDLAGPNIKHRTFKNNKEDIDELIKFVSALTFLSHLVLEASGGYERSAILALQQANIIVCRVDPYQVRAFARSMGKIAKTDKIDASLLAQFGKERHPRPMSLYDQAQESLRLLYRRRQHLVTLKIQESNRLQTALTPMREHVEESLKFIKKQLTEINALIKKHIASHQDIEKK